MRRSIGNSEAIGSGAGALGAVAPPEGPVEAGAGAAPWSPATVGADEAEKAQAETVPTGADPRARPLPCRRMPSRTTRKNDAPVEKVVGVRAVREGHASRLFEVKVSIVGRLRQKEKSSQLVIGPRSVSYE